MRTKCTICGAIGDMIAMWLSKDSMICTPCVMRAKHASNCDSCDEHVRESKVEDYK